MGRAERFDDFRVLALRFRRFAHRREIDDERNPGHILEQHARDHERHLFGAFRVRLPAGKVLQVRLGDLQPIIIAQRGLQHDAQAPRQARHFAESCFFKRGERVVAAGLAAVLKLLEGFEEVVTHDEGAPGLLTRSPRLAVFFIAGTGRAHAVPRRASSTRAVTIARSRWDVRRQARENSGSVRAVSRRRSFGTGA